MSSLQDTLLKLQTDIENTSLSTAEELEQFRIYYLGSKGLLKSLMAELKHIPVEEKKEWGQKLNVFKQWVEEKFNSAKDTLSENVVNNTSNVDMSMPAYPSETGARHPIYTTMDKMIHIFEKIGFSVAEGPEIEDDWHNFTALNLPEHHPARDMQDTFYIHKNPDWLLRTHTSSVQIRVMKEGKLPIRSIFPGRVYRNETISARAHCFFHQIEGLYIDKNVSFADLKQTLYYFVQEMFGEQVNVRFRPSYFPFTEPSAEMDVSCFICDSKGCNVCKHTGWVELLGCGMVHPNVLMQCNIDPEEYTGFAWGMGVERTAMMQYGIKDIRILSENDVRFLEQFKGVY
jgi:phenylalanyl-tRNA synthetase, alpha subunit (EC 6.1.1.20)